MTPAWSMRAGWPAFSTIAPMCGSSSAANHDRRSERRGSRRSHSHGAKPTANLLRRGIIPRCWPISCPTVSANSIASADVPAQLRGAQVRNITDVGDGRYDAIIRYTKLDDQWFELRSRWVRIRGRQLAGVQRAQHPRHAAVDGHHRTLPRRAGHTALGRAASRAAAAATLPAMRHLDLVAATDLPGVPFVRHGLGSRRAAWAPSIRGRGPGSRSRTESTGHLPYVVVLVELPGAGGRRVVGVLAHADGVTPQIGDAVRGEIEQPPDDGHWPLLRWHLDEAKR